MPKTKIALLYERLSRGDEIQGESFSIQNQEKICQGGISPSETSPQIGICRFLRLKYIINMNDNQHSFISPDSSSNAPVYTRYSLLVTDGPQAPSASTQLRPMHKPPVASADPVILGREMTSSGTALRERTAAVGSTTRPLAGGE